MWQLQRDHKQLQNKKDNKTTDFFFLNYTKRINNMKAEKMDI